jgi:DNA-binding FadR family transcriptional regulator
VNVARLAAKRITPEGKTQLEGALAANLAAGGAAVISTARLFHQLIGELSGNRALSLFNRVVLELNGGPVDVAMPDEAVAALKRNNVRLCDAICAGDEPLARRRMSEHMQDVAEWTALGLAAFR